MLWSLLAVAAALGLVFFPWSIRGDLRMGNAPRGYAITLRVALAHTPLRAEYTLLRERLPNAAHALRLLDRKGRRVSLRPGKRPQKRLLREIAKQIRLRRFTLFATLGTGDCAADALLCGGFTAVIQALVSPRCARLPRVAIRPALEQPAFRLQLTCIIRASIWNILYALVRTTPRKLREEAGKSNGNTGG